MELKGTELLAPAGSFESMKAAVAAGADAVYIGGSRFGARAYADNLDQDRMLEAIDYAHLHGVSLYMTVNTLVKEKELGGLLEYLDPYYRQGLDGVIVQDMGVLACIRRWFPKLSVHASTQMTITGVYGAEMLKELGVKRVVPARELSLEEIRRIHEQVNLEIECFVHGALCYCYSGQCLLSSLIGGRSGNRGRCAQPCRLPYDVKRDGRSCLDKDRRYVMSLKDLCVLDILPDLLEAGVYSLKIEGRMKSPRYTAGVVSIYRKYLDLYRKWGRGRYQVDPEDKRKLLDLFDRGGLTEGYYRQHNGKDMVALKEKPAFRQGNQKLFDYLDATYVNAEIKEKVTGRLTVREGEEICLSLRMEQKGKDYTAQVKGPVVLTARSQPVNEENLRKQMGKTGNTPFQFEALEVETEGNGFLPVQALNELRRKGLEKLKEAALEGYRRDDRCCEDRSDREEGEGDNWQQGNKREYFVYGKETADDSERKTADDSEKTANDSERKTADDRDSWQPSMHVLLASPDMLSAVLCQKQVSEIQIESDGFPPESWKQTAEACHREGKRCVLAMPVIFRREAEQYFEGWKDMWKGAGFDGILVRAWEEIQYLKHCQTELPVYGDHNLYCFNKEAVSMLKRMGLKRLTMPLELNSQELGQIGCGGYELIAYGYLPVMVSAQCIQKTTGNCTHKPGILYMKDRTGKELMVKNHCTFCYNTIYNPAPLSLLDQEKPIKRLKPKALRLQFVKETKQEIETILRAYGETFFSEENGRNDRKDDWEKDIPGGKRKGTGLPGDFTRGHFKRGVE